MYLITGIGQRQLQETHQGHAVNMTHQGANPYKLTRQTGQPVGGSSYALPPDMQSQSGFIMTLCKEAIFTASCKLKLNTKSSTESDLVAINDFRWPRYYGPSFLETQGMYVPTTTIY